MEGRDCPSCFYSMRSILYKMLEKHNSVVEKYRIVSKNGRWNVVSVY